MKKKQLEETDVEVAVGDDGGRSGGPVGRAIELARGAGGVAVLRQIDAQQRLGAVTSVQQRPARRAALLLLCRRRVEVQSHLSVRFGLKSLVSFGHDSFF